VRYERLRNIFLPPGPILVLTLIGLLLLSALLYYKAVRAQRYLEPSLSIAQPRVRFVQNINRLLKKEFGSQDSKGIAVSRNSIFVESSLIFPDPVQRGVIDHIFLEKMSNIFISMFQDPEMRAYFDLILVGTRFYVSPHMEVNEINRVDKQHIAELILNSLFRVEPGLVKYYGVFVATALPVQPGKKNNWIEFRIIPSEHLHIELMKSLKKYFF